MNPKVYRLAVPDRRDEAGRKPAARELTTRNARERQLLRIFRRLDDRQAALLLDVATRFPRKSLG